MDKIGLIAGSGRLPFLFADTMREAGVSVVAIGHRGETDSSLADHVQVLSWVRLGQLRKMIQIFRSHGITRTVMAGGIGRVKAFTDARPDLGALNVIRRLRSFRDDAILRAVAEYFESAGVEIVAPTTYLHKVLAPSGHLAGPILDDAGHKDVALGIEVAQALGKVDVGQTVVVKGGHVLALEAIEGTDVTIRRGASLGGKGAVVVKLCKTGQDLRFDLPAVGPATLEVMKEVGARALAVEAEKSILLDAPEVFDLARRYAITVVGIYRQE